MVPAVAEPQEKREEITGRPSAATFDIVGRYRPPVVIAIRRARTSSAIPVRQNRPIAGAKPNCQQLVVDAPAPTRKRPFCKGDVACDYCVSAGLQEIGVRSDLCRGDKRHSGQENTE